MDRTEASAFLQSHRQAVLATVRSDGRPQLSNVIAVYHGGAILVSITETRAKYHNIRRDPRVTLLFLGDNFWQYLVVDGVATLTHLAEAQPLLRQYYELASGPHPNWNDYDEAMRRERRVIASISVDHLYPLNP